MMSAIEFVSFCKDQLAKPYVWAGNGPSNFDCSGLVQFLLEPLGLVPPEDTDSNGLLDYYGRTGNGQRLASGGTPTLGSLAFFGGTGQIEHVGLCMNATIMIEAAGGDSSVTSEEIARQRGAKVTFSPISRRRDLFAIIEPTGLPWSITDGEVAGADIKADPGPEPGHGAGTVPQPTKFVSARVDSASGVVYTDDRGKKTLYRGGTLAWRNHNPGNITATTQFAAQHGSIGTDGKFAIFPSRDVGLAAMEALLKTSTYKSKSIRDAIHIYAPAADHNDPDAYVRLVQQWSGLDPALVIRDLTNEQMTKFMNAMIRVEGEQAGTIETLD